MKYTECYCSQDDSDKGSINCCTLPVVKCDTCERLMCQYHGSTFSHALTCRTPAENKALINMTYDHKPTKVKGRKVTKNGMDICRDCGILYIITDRPIQFTESTKLASTKIWETLKPTMKCGHIKRPWWKFW